MTPLQFIDWLDGALDVDELLQVNHGAGQVAAELREMIRRRMQAVDRTEVEVAQPEVKIPPPAHSFRLTRDVVKMPAEDKLSEETLAEIRESISRKVAEGGGSLKSYTFSRAPLAHDLFLRDPHVHSPVSMGLVNTHGVV
ncbi:hypothetical protein [Cupriavidus campinensis]|uniref:Uncharacterized protein n=1 Tax=Cupriavidus campinensis TaxID=151783 RepID=A0ABY3ESK4_9BURK|nr:hypothetical protein [Cupriavidus campinensis]TSP13941.1 hypothetical protein FGG12_05555 [Cupriavidus campinensis]